MKKIFAFLFCFLLLVCGCTKKPPEQTSQTVPQKQENPLRYVDVLPGYTGKPYTVINDNIPFFTQEDIKNAGTKSFEHYSDLDKLARCGPAIANIGKDIMPTEKRGPIGMVKPTGWHIIKFDFVDGKYLYNRCHLIGFQLAGENANPKNLITGTRYLNVVGMLPFENKVTEYVKRTNHHVLYRVTPIFQGQNLLAHGVLMEARSIEDNDILFNVFVHNVQPGVVINYKTGEAKGIKDENNASQKAIEKSIERHRKKVKKQ